VVIWPGDQAAYKTAAGLHAGRLKFVEQDAPMGYGRATVYVSLACTFLRRP